MIREEKEIKMKEISGIRITIMIHKIEIIRMINNIKIKIKEIMKEEDIEGMKITMKEEEEDKEEEGIVHNNKNNM